MQNNIEVSQIVNNRASRWLRVSTFLYLPQEHKSINSKTCLHPYEYCSALYNSQDLEIIQVPKNWWEDKEVMVDGDNRMLLSYKKWNPSVHHKLDETGGYYTEQSEAERGQIIMSHL